jgi:hypothetical protein
MANYIDQNIICEAYININKPLDSLTVKQREDIKKHLTEMTKKYAGFYLSPDIQTIVEAKDGSIRSYITILGTLITLYSIPLKSADFATVTHNLHKDSRRLAVFLQLESMFQYGAKDKDLTHAETRGGVIGSIAKITSRIESTKFFSGEDDDLTKLIIKLKETREDIVNLGENIINLKDKIFIRDNLKELLKDVPRKPSHPEHKTHKKERVEAYQEEIKGMDSALDKWKAKVPK